MALIIQSSYHLQLVDQVGVQGGVHTIAVLNDAYHRLFIDDGYLVLLPYRMWTDTLNPPKLPLLTLAARTGIGMDADCNYPGLRLSARMGTRTKEQLDLPVLSLDATMLSGMTASLYRRLPIISMLSAYSGARTGDLVWPALQLSVSMLGTLSGRLDKRMPGLSLSARASSSAGASLSKSFPVLALSATMTVETSASLDGQLPTIRASASMLSGASMTLSANWPSLAIDSALYGDVLSLNSKWPVLVTSIGTGQVTGVAAFMHEGSRFENYVLRHVR